ncbi:lytic murein transglycosylase [Erwinia mallotivora]|uniref:lytic murein transglycosylase n=1 Tax=Erwinia mallotivora TaxID=69222 RepID=UPI0035ED030B
MSKRNFTPRCLYLLITISLLSSCAKHVPAGSCKNTDDLLKSHNITADVEHSPTPSESFEEWQKDFRQYALSKGITDDTLNKAFDGITPDDSVIAATQKQPEKVTPIWEYIEKRTTTENIEPGKALMKQYSDVSNKISQRYEVEPSLLFAFLSVESDYGRNAGDKQVIRSLATLDYYNYRRDFFRQNLITALQMMQKGDASEQQMVGSWAGAMGMPQFMPESYQNYAVDYDGDRHPDIWTSYPDTLASVANYMHEAGWKKSVPWGVEVNLPANFDYSLAGLDSEKTIGQWRALGINAATQVDLATLSSENASVLLPAGKDGPAFLVTQNFRAIMRYNNYVPYAMTVGFLSDSYEHPVTVQKPWPVQEQPLTVDERKALQLLLQEKNLYQGDIDGNIGSASISAIRAYQKQQGLPEDGYPSRALLEKLLCS